MQEDLTDNPGLDIMNNSLYDTELLNLMHLLNVDSFEAQDERKNLQENVTENTDANIMNSSLSDNKLLNLTQIFEQNNDEIREMPLDNA